MSDGVFNAILVVVVPVCWILGYYSVKLVTKYDKLSEKFSPLRDLHPSWFLVISSLLFTFAYILLLTLVGELVRYIHGPPIWTLFIVVPLGFLTTYLVGERHKVRKTRWRTWR